MEFPFYVSKVFSLGPDNIAILDAAGLGKSSYLTGSPRAQEFSFNKLDSSRDGLVQILNRVGEASSIAQGLGATITTYSKFTSSGDHRAYIKAEGSKVYGILKIGKKNLFYYDSYGKVRELKALCVLDFYVHESAQRSGIGKQLFEKMLEHERVIPSKLAYDRPSPKLISFLKKHYGLVKFVPQNNNFVIFDAYWEDPTANLVPMKQKSRDSQPFEENRERKGHSYNSGGHQTSFNSIGKSIIESGHVSSLTKIDDSRATPLDYDSNRRTKHNMQNTSSESRLRTSKNTDNSELNASLGRTQAYSTQNSNIKPQVTYQMKTPWGSIGADDGMFRSSLAYGSHYNSGNFGYSRK